MSLAGEVARLIPPGTHDFLVLSRATSPGLRSDLRVDWNVIEAPAFRGRTVWSAAPDGLPCIETPNWWGRREQIPTGREVIVIDRRHDVVARLPSEHDDPEGWKTEVQTLRHCMRTASQLAGVTPAHGDPEAPWAILLLPIAAEAVAEVCRLRDIAGVAALEPRVPELPGALRLSLPAGAGSEWSAAVVASIQQATQPSGAL